MAPIKTSTVLLHPGYMLLFASDLLNVHTESCVASTHNTLITELHAEEEAARAAKLGKAMTDEELALHAAATRIQAHFRGHVVRKAYKLYRIGGAVSEVLYSPAAFGVDMTNLNRPKPRARIHANMAVIKNTLYLFGGIVEIGDKEVRQPCSCQHDFTNEYIPLPC